MRHHGLTPAFLRCFAAVPPAWGTAPATGEPVLIGDVTTSPIFAGQPALAVMLAAGFRSVHSYPLRDEHGALLGMLSLYYRAAGRHPGQGRLAWAATRALTEVRSTSSPSPAPPATCPVT
ncbi:GAF domain-containing protein [Actinoplanes flavus]|uniref:GAF domain-containing protein n=1 Tax=Actinoplanes flavus TaxID=2820290 RepID=A0ABS3UIK5_9ACTN|nr:GAF domain-containing protein [Actinoplanes flavus]MBO3737507.1 GAF domain-containing protein [Actinoplanes flavus]